jgi:peptidoglycan hydrolase-like protein with peptidoglycan-binding domain
MRESSSAKKIIIGLAIFAGIAIVIVILLFLRSTMQQQSGTSQTAAPTASNSSSTPKPSGSAAAIITPTPAFTPFADALTAKSGDRGLLVAALQARLCALGYFPYKPTGYFAAVTIQAVSSFQAANKLPVTGTAGTNTLALLFSNNVKYAASTPVPLPKATPPFVKPHEFGEALPFSQVSSLIPAGNGSKLLVVDLYSQYSFYAVRQGGAYHLEITPASAEDMGNFLSIFAGRTTFDKRACLVEYNGHIIAASLCGWLHGNTASPTLDLYFFGSTVDGVLTDAEHNANLLLASNGKTP